MNPQGVNCHSPACECREGIKTTKTHMSPIRATGWCID